MQRLGDNPCLHFLILGKTQFSATLVSDHTPETVGLKKSKGHLMLRKTLIDNSPNKAIHFMSMENVLDHIK
jgi:hypothetical protein